MNSLPPLFLASKSVARLRLMMAAGLSVTPVPTSFQEDTMRDDQAFESVAAYAQFLATQKAQGAQLPGRTAANLSHLIIGADQVLAHNGDLLHKATTLDEAADKLKRLQGSVHSLITALSVVADGAVIFEHVSTNRLTMRSLSTAEISVYVENNAEACLSAVGAYWIEGAGIQLFDQIEGDLFAVQGLPLLPLLKFFRTYHGDPVEGHSS